MRRQRSFAARAKSFTSRPGKAQSRHAGQRITVEHLLYRSGVVLEDPVPTEHRLFHMEKMLCVLKCMSTKATTCLAI
jgi:hypothetical protein